MCEANFNTRWMFVATSDVMMIFNAVNFDGNWQKLCFIYCAN